MSGFKDHFSTDSAGYAAYRPRYPIALAQALAEVAPDRRLAWDVGCGNGQLSELLAEVFAQVVATDASAAQIAAAPPHPRIDYRCAPAEDPGLPDAAADLIVAAQSAHWFDLTRFYAQARRVGAPGAVIALVSYGVTKMDGPVGAVLAQFYRDVAGPFWPPERRHVESGYAELPFPFSRLPPPTLAITADWPLDALLGYVGTWSAVAALRKVQGDAPLMDFAARLTAAWGDAAAPRRIYWPLALHFGRL